MEMTLVDCFVGQRVEVGLEYKVHVNAAMPITHEGWLLKNEDMNAYTLAFHTDYGDLDYLPVFQHEEINKIKLVEENPIDLNEIAPDWRPQQIENIEKENDGTTNKGPYQTSGLSWL